MKHEPPAGRRENKYSCGVRGGRLDLIRATGLAENLPGDLGGMAAQLIHASLAKETWNKYGSGWKAFQDYQEHVGEQFSWPLSDRAVRGFTVYCIAVRGLKPTSARTYLSALTCLQKLRGQKEERAKDPAVTTILKGAANLDMAAEVPRSNKRRAMTMPLLKHMGHRLAISGWDEVTKQSIWTAGLVAFFGTARMGELLASEEDWVDPTSTLTWKNIKYREEDDSFLIQIKLPKTGMPEGEYIDIFKFRGQGCCPVAALKKQQELQKAMGKGRQEDPVFIYPSGRFLTKDSYNKALRTLLEDVVDYSKDSVTCHSFRAGIPSLVNQFPELVSTEEIKGWGRWSSEAYSKYTRLKTEQKSKIFSKIAVVLKNTK